MRSESDQNGVQKRVRILMRFLDDLARWMIEGLRWMMRVCGRGGGQRRGGRLRSPFRYSSYSFLFSSLSLFNTPCYLAKDEVRRIYRLPPLPPTSPTFDDSMH